MSSAFNTIFELFGSLSLFSWLPEPLGGILSAVLSLFVVFGVINLAAKIIGIFL